MCTVCACVCVCVSLTTVLKSSFWGRMLLQDRQSAWQSLCPWSHRQSSSRATTVFMAGPTNCCATQNNADTHVQRNSSKILPVSLWVLSCHTRLFQFSLRSHASYRDKIFLRKAVHEREHRNETFLFCSHFKLTTNKNYPCHVSYIWLTHQQQQFLTSNSAGIKNNKL